MHATVNITVQVILRAIEKARGKAMRKTPMLVAFTILFSLPAMAEKQTTVEQLQQILAGAQAGHKTDEATLQQLADIKLTARLAGVPLQQLAAISPGPKTTQALRAIADQSAFLDPPPAEIPARTAPGVAMQKAIIGNVVHYVSRTLPTLPNFMAMRVTEQFSDLPQIAQQRFEPSVGLLYPLGSVRTPVAFRDGKESDDPALLAAASENPADRTGPTKAKPGKAVVTGLASWGEFGPILGIVLIDAAKGKLGWARWEQCNGKPAAVFQFSVDQSASHYNLQYWRYANGDVVGSRYQASRIVMGGFQSSNLGQGDPPTLFREVTAYHGTLTIDPDTGTILRITIEADLPANDHLKQAAIAVEYGPEKIGEGTFTCPTHSVTAFASVQKFQSSFTGPVHAITELQLNDVVFTGYRRFGSEATLVLNAPRAEALGVPAQAERTASTPPRATGAAPEPSAPAEPIEASAQPAAPPVPAPLPAPAEEQEMLVTAVQGLPGLDGEPANASHSSGSFTLKVTTRLVDMGLIATDKHGKPIADLKPEEIEIYDNGQKQHLTAVHHNNLAAPATTAQPVPAPQPSGVYTNAAATPADTQVSSDLLVLLMDESNLAFLDLNRAREETLRFLATSQSASGIALYSIGEKGFHVIQDVTGDRALVISKLKAWTPRIEGVAQAQASAPEQRNSMQPDTRADVLDLSDLQGNTTGIPVSVLANNLPLNYALQGMRALARHFAAVPGRKSIAWISGDAALAGWMGMKGGPLLETAIQKTWEALNEAHIVLYTVDASAPNLGAGGFDASVVNPNGDLPAIQNGPMGPRPLPASAPSQQAALGIQGPVRELAEATGGRAFSKGSDLKGTLDSIAQDSTALYEIAFNPDSQADNKLHELLVKVPSRKDIKLRYRSSYLYAQESANTQERFEQAVWSPQDAAGISLTAEAIPAADSGDPTVKLHISFPGLALERNDNRWRDRLYIFIAIRDDAAQKAEISGDTLHLALQQVTYDTRVPSGIPYQRTVQVPSKLGSVRLLVVDGNSGKIGSVTLPASALHL